jgi:hypothetical protein
MTKAAATKGMIIRRRLIPPALMAVISPSAERRPIANSLEANKDMGKVNTKNAGRRYDNNLTTYNQATFLIINRSVTSKRSLTISIMVKAEAVRATKFNTSLII